MAQSLQSPKKARVEKTRQNGKEKRTGRNRKDIHNICQHTPHPDLTKEDALKKDNREVWAQKRTMMKYARRKDLRF